MPGAPVRLAGMVRPRKFFWQFRILYGRIAAKRLFCADERAGLKEDDGYENKNCTAYLFDHLSPGGNTLFIQKRMEYCLRARSFVWRSHRHDCFWERPMLRLREILVGGLCQVLLALR